jgi:RNA polymerase sigma factor (sigma-70 family)
LPGVGAHLRPEPGAPRRGLLQSPALLPTKPQGPAGGDDLALVFFENVEFITRAIVRLSGPYLASEVDDLVQETFAEAFQNWRKFQPGSSARAWLHGVALRVVGSARRRDRVRRVFRLTKETASPSVGSASQQFEAKEDLALIYRVLDRMGDKKRALWILSEIDGLSPAEIAGVVGIAAGNVRVRLHEARKIFRRLLAKLDPELSRKSSRVEKSIRGSDGK